MKSLKLTFMLAFIASVLLVSGVLPALSQQQPVEKEAFSPEGTERNTELELRRPGAFPSNGDKILIRGPLVDTADLEQRIGSFTAELTIFRARRGLVDVEGTLRFPEGNIVFKGTTRLSERGFSQAIVAVVGGTGDFAGAGGTLALNEEQIDGTNGVRLTVNISP